MCANSRRLEHAILLTELHNALAAASHLRLGSGFFLQQEAFTPESIVQLADATLLDGTHYGHSHSTAASRVAGFNLYTQLIGAHLCSTLGIKRVWRNPVHRLPLPYLLAFDLASRCATQPLRNTRWAQRLPRFVPRR